MIDRDKPIPPPPPPLDVPPPVDPADVDRNWGLIVVMIIGAYLWIGILHSQLLDHINQQTRTVEERLAFIEQELGPGILPQTRTELQHIRVGIAELAHRMDMMELDFERAKSLSVPRKAPAR